MAPRRTARRSALKPKGLLSLAARLSPTKERTHSDVVTSISFTGFEESKVEHYVSTSRNHAIKTICFMPSKLFHSLVLILPFASPLLEKNVK